MNQLEERILASGKVLPGNILKVDTFLNHLVDTELLEWCGEEFYRRFKDEKITKVLTVEASGIIPAYTAAKCFGVPLLFAKKAKSMNIGDDLYTSTVKSYTYEKEYVITISKDFLNADDCVLIIDDFLARGQASLGLLDICNQAKAKVVGLGFCVEKSFQEGAKAFREKGYHVESLAKIKSLEDGKIELV